MQQNPYPKLKRCKMKVAILFFMSLIFCIIHKTQYKKHKTASVSIMLCTNIIGNKHESELLTASVQFHIICLCALCSPMSKVHLIESPQYFLYAISSSSLSRKENTN